MQRGVRTDDPHQGHARKVQAFGDHLRADQNVDFPAAERPERFVIRTLARHGVRIHARHPGRGKHLLHHRLDFFRAHPAESDLRIVALRTPPRRLLRVTADVAAGQVLLFVQGERNTAVRTLHIFPAGLAGQHGEKSAAVEKKNRLLALGQARLNGQPQLWRNELVVTFPVLAPQTHVDHTENRQHATVVAMAQFEQIVFPLPAVLESFQRRRGRPEQHRARFHLPAHHGQIARMVTRPLVLLVRIVMLLVDDDEPWIFQGRENRPTRSDHNARLPAPHPVPFVVALPLAQMTVQHRDRNPLRREARGKALDSLRGKGNFRDQHERRFPRSEHLIDGAQVNLRLPAARNAFEHDRLVRGRITQGRTNPFQRVLLLGTQDRRL